MTNPVLTSHGTSVLNTLEDHLRKYAESREYDAMESFLDRQSELQWWGDGTARLCVAGLGRTVGGSSLATPPRRIVAKFSFGDRDSNEYESNLYKVAKQRGDEGLFADVIGHSDNYSWIAMTECIPIYRNEPYTRLNSFEYIIDPDRTLGKSLLNELKNRGWGPLDLLKNGNHGIHPDGRTVAIDYNHGWSIPME